MEQRRRDPLLRSSRAALRYRDLSRSAIDAKLRTAGIAEPARQKALDELAGAGYVDDARTASLRAARFAERGYGDALIEARLRQEGLRAGRCRSSSARVSLRSPSGRRASRLAAAETTPGALPGCSADAGSGPMRSRPSCVPSTPVIRPSYDESLPISNFRPSRKRPTADLASPSERRRGTAMTGNQRNEGTTSWERSAEQLADPEPARRARADLPNAVPTRDERRSNRCYFSLWGSWSVWRPGLRARVVGDRVLLRNAAGAAGEERERLLADAGRDAEAVRREAQVEAREQAVKVCARGRPGTERPALGDHQDRGTGAREGGRDRPKARRLRRARGSGRRARARGGAPRRRARRGPGCPAERAGTDLRDDGQRSAAGAPRVDQRSWCATRWLAWFARSRRRRRRKRSNVPGTSLPTPFSESRQATPPRPRSRSCSWPRMT